MPTPILLCVDDSESRSPRSLRGMTAALAAALGLGLGLGLAPAPDVDAKPSAAIGVNSAVVRTALRDHELRTLDGKTLTLGSLRGEVVVVNFWATWCSPCRKELPELAALHAEIARRGGRVVAISIDHDLRNVRRFVRKHALAIPVAHDGPDGLARRLDLNAVPLTMVLDRAGEVACTAGGAGSEGLDRVRAVTRELLATTPPVSRRLDGESP